MHSAKNRLSQSSFIQRTGSFVQRTSSFVQDTSSFVQRTSSFIQRTSSFVQRKASSVQRIALGAISIGAVSAGAFCIGPTATAEDDDSQTGWAAQSPEVVYLFRSFEDPTMADPTVCERAGFPSNVLLGAALYSIRTRPRTGRVTDDAVQSIGTATACVLITDPTFPVGAEAPMYLNVDIELGPHRVEHLEASGTCHVTSNDVPSAGVALTGCNLEVIVAPEVYQGGIITSASVFNPRSLPGIGTGSFWTARLVRAD